MRLLAQTSDRVEHLSAKSVNDAIDADIEKRLRYYSQRISDIESRLRELDREWDVERTIEANASTIALAGLGLGLIDRRFNIIPAVVAGFLLMHAIQGWCPPVPILRRLGFRSSREINMERYGLKALRGDLDELSHNRSGHDSIRLRHALEALR